MAKNVLKLYPHWDNKRHMFRVVGPEIKEDEPKTTIEVYEFVDKFNLKRLYKQPIKIAHIENIILDVNKIEFENPIIEYI